MTDYAKLYSLAEKIKLTTGIPHHTALNQAALSFGCECYAQFLTRYGKHQTVRVGVEFRLDSGEGGCEWVGVRISQPLNRLAGRRIRERLGGFHDMSWRPSTATVRSKGYVDSQLKARQRVCEMARRLQFMDATRLTPATEAEFDVDIRAMKPTAPDHASLWWCKDGQDGAKGFQIIADEPYQAGNRLFWAEREDWCRHHGLIGVLSEAWLGMYAPEAGSQLFLICQAGPGREAILRSLVAQLGSIEQVIHGPIAPNDPFEGDSEPLEPWNLAAIGQSEPNAVLYGHPVRNPQWRPDGRISVAGHFELADAIDAIRSQLVAYSEAEMTWRLIRSTLNAWSEDEYAKKGSLPDEIKWGDWYLGNRPTPSSPVEERPETLVNRVVSRLKRDYPPCRPLEELLASLADARLPLPGPPVVVPHSVNSSSATTSNVYIVDMIGPESWSELGHLNDPANPSKIRGLFLDPNGPIICYKFQGQQWQYFAHCDIDLWIVGEPDSEAGTECALALRHYGQAIYVAAPNTGWSTLLHRKFPEARCGTRVVDGLRAFSRVNRGTRT